MCQTRNTCPCVYGIAKVSLKVLVATYGNAIDIMRLSRLMSMARNILLLLTTTISLPTLG